MENVEIRKALNRLKRAFETTQGCLMAEQANNLIDALWPMLNLSAESQERLAKFGLYALGIPGMEKLGMIK